jgi:hypothetical protein
MCSERAEGIALAHEEERTQSSVTLVVDTVLRPAPGLVVGNRLREVTAPAPLHLVFLLPPSSPIRSEVFGVTERGTDCLQGGVRVCDGKIGLTPQQVVELNGFAQCKAQVDQVGYNCGDPGSCGCELVPSRIGSPRGTALLASP